MRHQVRKLKLGISKGYATATVRNLLTSLLEHGKLETTEKKAKILKAHMDKLIGRTVDKNASNSARMVDEVVYTKRAKDQFRKFKDVFKKDGSSVRMTKMRKRPGDNATVVQVELITN